MFQGLLKLHVAAQASDQEAAMMVNRVLNNEILSAAASAYPRDALPDQFIGKYDLDEVAGSLFYLAEHELIKNFTQISLDGIISWGPFTATHKGIDFMADDGGLSAILGVLTVRFDESTLKQLLLAKIDGANADPSAKDELKESVRKLPSKMLEKLTEKLLEAGLAHLPQLVPLMAATIHNL
jgi:hypothetical protein